LARSTPILINFFTDGLPLCGAPATTPWHYDAVEERPSTSSDVRTQIGQSPPVFSQILFRFANLFTFEMWRKGEGLPEKMLNYRGKLVGGTGIEPVTPPV